MAKVVSDFLVLESGHLDLVIGKTKEIDFSLPKNTSVASHNAVLFFRIDGTDLEDYHFEMHMNRTDFKTPDAKTRIFALHATGDQPFMFETYHAIISGNLLKTGTNNQLSLSASGLTDGSGKARFFDFVLMFKVEV